jgi:hypothetical protein
MKSIISTTYDHQYLFYLPITTWLWNKLGVDVICFMPKLEYIPESIALVTRVQIDQRLNQKHYFFSSPKNKEATYAQCSRLFAGGLTLPENEILITSDIDMAVFKKELYNDFNDSNFLIFGSDLVPEAQFPMCYIAAPKNKWESFFNNGKSYQQCLDDLLGSIECENMRGNYWAKDQEHAFKIIGTANNSFKKRARPGTQFASNRIDRDDAFFMDRLSPDIIDYHMHRPGYTDENFEKILAVIQYFYPNDDLSWMREYQQQYKSLL